MYFENKPHSILLMSHFFYQEKNNLKYVKIHIIFRRGSRLWLTVVLPCSIVPPTFTYIAWYFSEWTLMSAPSVVLSATPLSRLIDDQILSDDSFHWQPIMDILLERKVSMKGVYRLSKLEWSRLYFTININKRLYHKVFC